jgi:hypothetical protein
MQIKLSKSIELFEQFCVFKVFMSVFSFIDYVLNYLILLHTADILLSLCT